ncbi:MAG: alpha-amylase [Anaerolineae bacterium]|nr:alpha-amylase [Anaerolineae bacterium]
MEEHIFGTYATDDLKLVHHRAMRRGIQHWNQLAPRDPAPGEPVRLTVRVGPELTVTDMAVYYTTDGSLPAGSRGHSASAHVVRGALAEVMWDTLVFDYLQIWEATLPAQPEGTTVRYRIGAWAGEEPEVFADWPDANLLIEKAAEAFFHEKPMPDVDPGDPARGTNFLYTVDRFSAPRWARDAVIYEVFPDRFFPGEGRDWLQTEDVSGFCGGTLQGVAEKLDYIEALGATAIWLTPIFPSPTHHGYDATDYRRVEERLGGEAGLRLLVEQAHARGIRIILDLVCNHISHEHPIFVEALADPASPYRDWFTFNDSEIGYRSFFGVQQMPQLNMQHEAAAEWMIGHARFWLEEFDVDGYRLDYALGPGPDFWSRFTAECKRIKPDCFVFGEIVDSPKAIQAYIGRLDGNLDFHIETALRRTYAYGTWSEAQFERFVARHLAYFPESFVMPSFLDNHDTDRFLYIAGEDKEALKRAAAAQMRLPAPPVIYYGTEVGLSQATSKHGLGLEVSRAVMPWGAAQDAGLLAFYREIIAERKRARTR